MKRVCLFFLLLAVFPSKANPAPVDRAVVLDPQRVITSVYSITFVAAEAMDISAGSILTCQARIAPILPWSERLNALPAPVEGSRTPAGCTVEIPFSWLANRAQNGAALSYEVRSVSGIRTRTITQEGVVVQVPPSGSSVHLQVTVSF
jgi:hypothetical protein